MAHAHAHHDQAHHDHSHRTGNRVRLAGTLALTLVYMVAEVTGGYLSGSLALLADAGHMLSDAAALGLSLFAAWISLRPPTPQLSYGYYRAEILAALANGTTLIAISIFVFVEAIGRLNQPAPVAGELMAGIAAGGLVVNLLGLAILHGGRGDNLNMQGAWLHLMTDALGSLAALAAGGLVWTEGWNWADPVASIFIGLLVIYSSWSLLKQAIAILMLSAPSHLDVDVVRAAILSVSGVGDVHDLHIWTITSGMESLSAHVLLADGFQRASVLDSLRQILQEQFGIDHVTIQIETDSDRECQTPF